MRRTATSYASKPDFAQVEYQLPADARRSLPRSRPKYLAVLDQEQVDQIYARLSAGPIPDGAFDGESVLPARRAAASCGCRRDRRRRPQGPAGERRRARSSRPIGEILWKGKVFYRDERVLRNRIEDLAVLKAAGLIEESRSIRQQITVDGKDAVAALPRQALLRPEPARRAARVDHHRLRLHRRDPRLPREARLPGRPARPHGPRRDPHGAPRLLSRPRLHRPRLRAQLRALQQGHRRAPARTISGRPGAVQEDCWRGTQRALPCSLRTEPRAWRLGPLMTARQRCALLLPCSALHVAAAATGRHGAASRRYGLLAPACSLRRTGRSAERQAATSTCPGRSAALLARLGARLADARTAGLRIVLIPLGRSLQRHRRRRRDYFAIPRVRDRGQRRAAAPGRAAASRIASTSAFTKRRRSARSDQLQPRRRALRVPDRGRLPRRRHAAPACTPIAPCASPATRTRRRSSRARRGTKPAPSARDRRACSRKPAGLLRPARGAPGVDVPNAIDDATDRANLLRRSPRPCGATAAAQRSRAAAVGCRARLLWHALRRPPRRSAAARDAWRRCRARPAAHAMDDALARWPADCQSRHSQSPTLRRHAALAGTAQRRRRLARAADVARALRPTHPARAASQIWQADAAGHARAGGACARPVRRRGRR